MVDNNVTPMIGLTTMVLLTNLSVTSNNRQGDKQLQTEYSDFRPALHCLFPTTPTYSGLHGLLMAKNRPYKEGILGDTLPTLYCHITRLKLSGVVSKPSLDESLVH